MRRSNQKRGIELDDETVAAFVKRELSQNILNYIAGPLISTYEWKSGMPKFPPGRYRQIAAFRSRKRRPGLFFCGDYLMGPFVEAAITTGMEAAESIEG